MFGRLFATWYELASIVDPRANAMAQVRMKPVIREMMTKKLIRAADDPTLVGVCAVASEGEIDSSSDVEICVAFILRFRVWV